MSPGISSARERGFSLVELAVALSIAALLTAVLVALLPLGNQVIDGERQREELAQAEQALLGYMRSHGRLPTADTDNDGRADGAVHGLLPVTDLGLPRRVRIHYQAQSNLTAPMSGELFDPVLPPADQPAPNANALDLCMRLLLNQRERVTMAGLDMPMAYYLGHSGVAGHGRADADADWNPAAQRLPGGHDASGQLATLAAGVGEIASRLSCTDRLARAQGSAQAAYAAYSARNVTVFNLEFRNFDIHIAETIRDQAKAARDLAAYALAESITNQAIAITMLASGWPPDGATITAGVKLMAESVYAIADAIKGLVEAQDTYDEALAGVNDAEFRRDQVDKFMGRTNALYESARDTTIGLDRAGLNQ